MNHFLVSTSEAGAILARGYVGGVFNLSGLSYLIVNFLPEFMLQILEIFFFIWDLAKISLFLVLGKLLKFSEGVAILVLIEWFGQRQLLQYLESCW